MHEFELPELEVSRIDSADTIALRHAVLRPSAPLADCHFPGDDDALTFHAGVRLNDRIVSIASIYREARPTDAGGGAPCAADHAAGTAWRLRGMATQPELRRSGAGRAALAACLAHAREHDGTLAWCNARMVAIGFYQTLGWTTLGTQFDIPGVGPHLVMELRLA